MLIMFRKDDDVFNEITRNTDLTNPVWTTHDGQTGGIVTLQLYLKNDDVAKWYSNVTVQPIDLVDAYPYGDVGYDETGWGVKLSEGSTEPTIAQWEDIDWGNTITMPDITDAVSYIPFWYLISCPPLIDAKTKTDIVLRTAYTENV